MIGKYILSGRIQAITAITLSALISFLLPPFAFLISGSVVGLLTLRKGIVYTLHALVISGLILQIFFIFLGISLYINSIYILIIWLPILFLSTILRFSGRQGILIFFAGLITTILVIIFYLTIGDVSTWWQERLDLVFEQSLAPEQLNEYRLALASTSGFINGIILAGFMMNMIMSVLFARWWQSRLFNLGGFRKEFYRLRIPTIILPVFIIILVLALTVNDPWQDMFKDILIVSVFVYLIQGISFAHRTVDKLKLSVGWLVFLYCLLMLVPQMGLIIACFGIVDVFSNWISKNQDSEKES